MTPEDLQQIAQLVAAAEQRIIARQDRAVETIATETSAFREETNARFAAIDRQFEAVHSRLDRTNNMLTLLQGGTTTLNTWADRADRHTFDQQREIDEIKRRLEALEKKAS